MLYDELHSSNIIAGLGALGVALQNYQAVVLFISDLTKSFLITNQAIHYSIQMLAFGTGAICSGLVNLWMNIELLESFFKRINSDKDYQINRLQLSEWEKIQYFSGIFVFVVTGLLFGLMAFTFSAEGPFALLSIAAGLFVSMIMTIQEVETWLSSYDSPSTQSEESLNAIALFGKYFGHLIAIGNVFALSTLFTLSLTQSLMFMQLATIPALMIGASIAFTFGAFTEYYFYNYYLSTFCQNFIENWTKMSHCKQSTFGFFCVSTNALVNAALTYAGIELLKDLLLASSIISSHFIIFNAVAISSAIFAGSASFILGLDFWIRQNPSVEAKEDHLIDSSSNHSLCFIH